MRYADTCQRTGDPRAQLAAAQVPAQPRCCAGATTTTDSSATALDKRGTRIEDFDIAFAAHALAYDAILVTANGKHMRRIRGLRVEDSSAADGGVADYHFGAEIDAAGGLTLYPHFYSQLIPGFFDKGLCWRRTRDLRRTILLAPSAACVASLPGAKIPDRNAWARSSSPRRCCLARVSVPARTVTVPWA